MRYAPALAAVWLVAAAGCNPQRPKATPPSAFGARTAAPATPLVLKITGQGTLERPVHVFQQVHNRVDYDLVASSYESSGSQGRMRSIFQDARVQFRDRQGATIRASAPQAVVERGCEHRDVVQRRSRSHVLRNDVGVHAARISAGHWDAPRNRERRRHRPQGLSGDRLEF